jgi:hypothetical protein
MSACSAVTWCTKKGPREKGCSRSPAALSRQDLPCVSVLANPGNTSVHAHAKPCSHICPPSCVVRCCGDPATTRTPHSPAEYADLDAASVRLVIEPLALVCFSVVELDEREAPVALACHWPRRMLILPSNSDPTLLRQSREFMEGKKNKTRRPGLGDVHPNFHDAHGPSRQHPAQQKSALFDCLGR